MENKDITKALEPIKIEIGKLETYATALAIKTPEDLKEATNELGTVKAKGKQIAEMKEGITKPMMIALKNVRFLFAPLEIRVAMAEATIKQKMIAYDTIATAKAEVKKDKIAADVEAGKISFDKGVEKLAKVAEPARTVTADNGAISYRIIRKVVVEDETKLPREYLVPDLVKIRTDALAGKEIAGVKVVEEKVVSART